MSQKIHHNLINNVTALLAKKRSQVLPVFKNPDRKIAPVWITGMYRSGTSVFTRTLAANGADLGNPDHLLKPIGHRAGLNPEGFHENYLFMEWSTYLFKQSGTWGDNPPPPGADLIHPNKINQDEFIEHCINFMHDDRISNINKLKLLKAWGPGNANRYLKSQFTGRPFIKNPHVCVLHDYFKALWPGSRFIVLVRHPEKTISSSKKVSATVTYETYKAYYDRHLYNDDVTLVCFESFTQDPEGTLNALHRITPELNSSPICKGIIRHDPPKVTLPEGIANLYETLLNRCINR